jgi:hypothetical protein
MIAPRRLPVSVSRRGGSMGEITLWVIVVSLLALSVLHAVSVEQRLAPSTPAASPPGSAGTGTLRLAVRTNNNAALYSGGV